MTIAERMAALKASAESHSTPTDEPGPSGVTPISTGGRRVSIGLVGLGAKINLAALSPNAVRPPIKKDIEAEAGDATQEKAIEEEDGALTPKSNRVSFSAQENGEFKHVSLYCIFCEWPISLLALLFYVFLLAVESEPTCRAVGPPQEYHSFSAPEPLCLAVQRRHARRPECGAYQSTHALHRRFVEAGVPERHRAEPRRGQRG